MLLCTERTNESGSGKRKKATAKANKLRAVVEKTKPITRFLNVTEGHTVHQRWAQDPAFYDSPAARRRSKNFV